MNNKYNTCFKLFSMIFSSKKNQKQLLSQKQESALELKTKAQVKSDQEQKTGSLVTPSFLGASLKPATTDLK